MAYEDEQQDDFVPWEPPEEEEPAISERAQVAPQQEETATPEHAQATAGRVDDFVPWEPPQQQQQQTQSQTSKRPDDFVPWEPPQERPEAEGVIGTTAREAAGATPATLGGLAAGAGAAGAGRVAGAALGRVVGGLAGTWGGPAGSVAGWIGGGLAGGYIGEEIANGIKSFLGFNDDAQKAANREANPMAAAAGQVAPLALGLSPGRGVQAGARLLSGGVGGAIEGATQAVEGEFSKERLAANIIGGILLPGNKQWLTNIEERAAARAGGGARPVAPPTPSEPRPRPGELDLTEGRPGTSGGPQGQLDIGGTEPSQPRPSRDTSTGQSQLPLEQQPEVGPHGQYEMPIEPRTQRDMFPEDGLGRAPERPGAAPAEPSTAGGQYELPVDQPHGSPGPKADAPIAEAQAPPPGAKAGGPENWGKKPATVEGADTGVNIVTGVEPTLAHAIEAKAPAQQAGILKDLEPRVDAILKGPSAEAAGKFREIGDAYRKMGQAGQAAKYDSVAKELDRQHALQPPEKPPAAAAAARPAEVLRGPEPAAPVRTVGDQLKAKQAERVAAEKATPVTTDTLPTRSIGNLRIEPNPAGGHVLMRGDEAISQHPTIGPAMIAMNRAAKEAGGTPVVQQQQQQQPQPQPIKPNTVRTHDGAVFTGATTDEAAAHAHAAGYRPGQVFRPRETAAPSGGAPPKPPPGGEPPGQPPGSPTPPPLGTAGGAPRPSAAAPRRFEGVRAAGEKVLRRWQETFQPETITPGALRAEPVFRGMKSARSGERDRVFHATQEGERRWNNTPEDARYSFLSDVENGRAVKPEHIADKNNLQRMLDEANQLEKDAGLKAAYRENYFPHEWKKKADQAPISEYLTKTLGPNWFQKGRTIDLIEQGIAAGYELKNSNPFAAVRSRLIAGADLRMQKRLLDDLQKMGMAGHVEEGTSKRLLREGHQAINGPDGKQWMLSPEVQPLWKNAISGKGMWSNPNLTGDVFKAWMQFKAFWVPIKLSLSGFHVLHVAHINFSSNIARALDQAIAGDANGAMKSMGQAFTTTFRPRAAVGTSTIRSKDVQAQWLLGENARSPEGKLAIQHMEEGGFVPHMSEQLRSDAVQKLDDAWKAKNPFGLAYHGPRELVRRMQAPIFEQWIPRVKTSAYLNDVAALLERKPELNNDPQARKIALSAIAKSIDNRFGEMFYDGLFWNKMAKDTSIGSMLSLGWNLGFAREFGGAAVEAVTRPAGKFIPGMAPSAERAIIRDATNKIKFASVYMGTAMMIGGMMTKAFTGNNPEELNDYIFPRVSGLNPDGSPRRLTTMFYTREVPMLGKHIEEHGGGIGGTLAGVTSMLWNKTLFQPFLEMYQNRNYFGSEIWNPHSPGYEQFMQAGRHFFGNQFSPMTITGAQRIEETGGQPFEKALAFTGFGPAPSYADKSAIQNKIAHLFQQHVAPADRPYKDPDVDNEQRTARNKLLMAIQRKDPEERRIAYKAAIDAGLKPEQLGKLGKTFSDQNMFQRLPQADQIEVLEQSTPTERQRYWPHVNAKTRLQWNKEHPVQTQ